MEEELKNKIVETFQYLAKQNGKLISITDRITTVENNYDRHFTTTSTFEIKQASFGIRISGGIGMLIGENQSFEFRSDTIQDIKKSNDEIEFVIKIKESVFRLIQIKIN